MPAFLLAHCLAALQVQCRELFPVLRRVVFLVDHRHLLRELFPVLRRVVFLVDHRHLLQASVQVQASGQVHRPAAFLARSLPVVPVYRQAEPPARRQAAVLVPLQAPDRVATLELRQSLHARGGHREGPSVTPSVSPIGGPNSSPSRCPSASPSTFPSSSPSSGPSTTPSDRNPERSPSAGPSSSPSSDPSGASSVALRRPVTRNGY
jgi:hypothetical protein